MDYRHLLKLSRRLTLAVFLAALASPSIAFSGAPQSEKEDDGLRKRWEWFRMQRAYPKINIPDGARTRALRQQAAVPEYHRRSLRSSAGAKWTFLGPSGFDSTIEPSWGRMSGRTRSLVIDPGNSMRIFLGTATGGVWRSTDGGSSWNPLTDTQDSLSIGSLAMDPQDSNTIYAGTGEGPAGAYYSVGILKSTDGGDNWTLQAAGTFDRHSIPEIIVSPSDANVVLACSNSGAHQPGEAIVFDLARVGIFRSTDGGNGFTQTQGGLCNDLVFDPTNFNVQYASMTLVNGGDPSEQDGIYKSSDAGQSWSPLTDNGAPTSASRLNIGISADGMTLYAGGKDGGGNTQIWKSTDAGASWAPLAGTPDYCQAQCFYDNDVVVSPANADHAYFAGVGFFRTLDGGATFDQLGTDSGGGPLHVDHHILVFDPNDTNTFYDGNDGGLYRSNDIGTVGNLNNGGPSWTSLTGTSLGSLQFYDIALHPTDPNIMLGGLQDNGTEVRSQAGGNVWVERCGGDGGFAMIDHANPSIMYCSANSQVISISKSSDGGQTFAVDVSLDQGQERKAFIPPVIMDPVTSTTLYAGTQRLWRSTDGGSNWAPIGPADLTGGDPATISHFEIAPSNPMVIWVVTSDGKVQRSSDAGATFTDATKAPLPRRFATEVAVHPTDPNTAYVGFSGFDDNTPGAGGHLFRSSDGGATWTDLTNNLPDIPVNAIEIRPDLPSEIYAGTDLGLFISTDSGTSWAKFTGGLPNVGIIRVKANRGTDRLVVATHGRGVWSTGLGGGAGDTLQFAQFGNGQTLSSEIVLTNPSSNQLATGEITLFEKGGTVLDLRQNLSATAGVDLSQPNPTFSIAPLGSVRIATDGGGPLVSGSVAVNSNSALGGVIRFQIAGIGVAGVGAGEPFKKAIVPVQRVGTVNTGIAVRNGSPDQTVQVQLTLRDLAGNTVAGGQTTLNLPPNSRRSEFINELFTGATTEGLQGTVTLESADSITALALELGAVGELTTLPVTPFGGGIAAQSPIVRTTAPIELQFAQFGNGNGLSSEIVLTSPTPSNGQILMFDLNGQLLDLRPNLQASGPIDDSSPAIEYSLPVNRSLRLKTDGAGGLSQGSALVLSDAPIGGVIRFTIAGIGVAGVGAAKSVNRAIAPVQRMAGGINTGLAIRNGSETETAAVTIRLRDLQGNEVAGGMTSFNLGPDSRVARFIDELFPDALTDGLAGTVTVESSIPVALIALELGQVGQFTTLPVTELAASP